VEKAEFRSISEPSNRKKLGITTKPTWERYKDMKFTVLRDSKGQIIPYYTGKNIYESWLEIDDDREELNEIVSDNDRDCNMNSDEVAAYNNMDLLQSKLEYNKPRFSWWPYAQVPYNKQTESYENWRTEANGIEEDDENDC
jgi:hypothetical protein